MQENQIMLPEKKSFVEALIDGLGTFLGFLDPTSWVWAGLTAVMGTDDKSGETFVDF